MVVLGNLPNLLGENCLLIHYELLLYSNLDMAQDCDQLLCPSANLSFRLYHLIYNCELKKPCKK